MVDRPLTELLAEGYKLRDELDAALTRAAHAKIETHPEGVRTASEEATAVLSIGDMGRSALAYTPDEFAAVVKLPRRAVANLCASGEIPGAFQIAGQWRIPTDNVLDSLAAATAAAHAPRKRGRKWFVFWRKNRGRWALGYRVGGVWKHKTVPSAYNAKAAAEAWAESWLTKEAPVDGPTCAADIKEIRPWPSTGGVYFLHLLGFVKIGVATNIADRLMNLSTAFPALPRLLLVLPGERKEEREYQQRFASLRARCEWFHARGDIVRFIAEQRRNIVADT